MTESGWAGGVERGDAPRVIREVRVGEEVPLFAHPEWAERFPWLCQGTTGAWAGAGDPFDLRLFGGAPGSVGVLDATPDVAERWEKLRTHAGFRRVAHARQLHGRRITVHPSPGERAQEGLALGPPCDGHCTDSEDVLLAVATADCTAVSLVDPDTRVVALLHAGWRGAAAGILEEGVHMLSRDFGVEAARLHLHLGPSICGACYEVGPEVFRGLGLPVPPGPEPLDLRGALRRRARVAGIADARMTTSAFCTRCGDSPFFSHRGGDRGRQVSLLGVRAGRRTVEPEAARAPGADRELDGSRGKEGPIP